MLFCQADQHLTASAAVTYGIIDQYLYKLFQFCAAALCPYPFLYPALD